MESKTETGWQPIETAPRDGTWFLAEGEFLGGDTSSVRLCRYAPADGYEWQVIEFEAWPSIPIDEFDRAALPTIPFNWISDGRVHQWQQMPE